jgi:uncharacterized protein (TIGR02453 family)
LARSTFGGFPPAALTFFRSLRRNNNREWFQARKHVFDEQVKRPMTELVQALNQRIMDFAPDYVTDPEKAIYRIYRDTRFSNDKTPYKDRIAASFRRRGMARHAGAGLYFSVSDREVEVAGGIYMPGPEQLLAVRTLLAGRHQDFRKITGARQLRKLLGDLQGDRLTRVPKGFAAGHPAADLLRYKQLLFYVLLEGSLATSPRLLGEIEQRFRVLMPFIEFLNAPLARQANRTRDPILL